MTVEFSIDSYEQADNLLRDRDSRYLKYKTWLARRDGGTIALVHHTTDIVTYMDDGRLCLNNGGFWSSTTKYRIEWGTPDNIHVWNRHGMWMVGMSSHPISKEEMTRVPFTPSMLLVPDGDHPRGWRVRHANAVSWVSVGSESVAYRLRGLFMDYARCFVLAKQLGWEATCDRCKEGPNADDIMDHIMEGEYPRELLFNAIEVCAGPRWLRAALNEWQDGTPFPAHCVQSIKTCISRFLHLALEEELK